MQNWFALGMGITQVKGKKYIIKYVESVRHTGGFPHEGPVMKTFDVCSITRLNKLLNKQMSCNDLISNH